MSVYSWFALPCAEGPLVFFVEICLLVMHVHSQNSGAAAPVGECRQDGQVSPRYTLLQILVKFNGLG